MKRQNGSNHPCGDFLLKNSASTQSSQPVLQSALSALPLQRGRCHHPCEILLIRHGRTAWNQQKRYQGHTDVPLDEIGEKMSLALAERLQVEAIDAIYSSDLRRAKDTAQPAADLLGIELRLDWRLRESRLRAHEPNPPYPVLPFSVELESTGEVLQRAKLVLHEIAFFNQGKRVAVVSHGGISRRFLNWVLASEPAAEHCFANINAALNYIRWNNGRWSVLQLNDAAHLEKAGLLPSNDDAG